MNVKIHNEEVASFKDKVKNHEEDIINSKKIAHDLNEFVALHEELNGIQNEYFELSEKNDDIIYKKELEAYLREEVDYLELIVSLFNQLEAYHDTIGLVDSNMIENEWEDLRIIVTYRNVESSLKRVESLIKSHPEDQQYMDLYEDLKRQYEKLEQKVIKAQHNMIDKSDTIFNSQEVEQADDKANLLVNEEVYENMDVIEKIEYVSTIMQNIEKARGKKRTLMVNGERKNIAKKYAHRYLRYNSMLNNLYIKREEQERIDLAEIAKNIQFETAAIIQNEYIDEYWDLRNEMENISGAYKKLALRAALCSDQEVIHVTYPNGNMARILKTDLEAFEELEERAKHNEYCFEEIMIKYGSPAVGGMSKGEKKKEFIEEIRFLKENGVAGEELQEKINELVDIYYKTEKRSKFLAVANLAYIFRKMGWSKEEANEMAKIAYNPEALQKDSNVTTEEKNKKLSNIFKSLFAASEAREEDEEELAKAEEAEEIEHEEKEEISLKEKIGMGIYKHVGGTLGYLYGVGLDIKPYAAKALKSIKSLPKKGLGFISKIKATKKPINKEALKANVKKRGTQVAAVLGMTFLVYMAAKSNQNKDIIVDVDNTNKLDNEPTIESQVQINQDAFDEFIDQMEAEAETMGDKIFEETNKNEVEITPEIEAKPEVEVQPEVKPEVETEGIMSDNELNEAINEINIGGVFTTDEGAPIYTNMYDASNETNAKKAYFEADSNRVITAIVYNYNGSEILLEKNDPEFEAKKTALETNGAVAVAVRSQNENSQDLNNYEGYWNVDDINLGGRR